MASKKYIKLHSTIEIAKIHIKKIQEKGGQAKLTFINKKYKVEYSYSKNTAITICSLKQILTKAQIPFDYELSHIHGSEYMSIQGIKVRISDHDKPKGYDLNGRLDFRSVDALYKYLITKLDLKDKTKEEIKFKNLAKKKVIETKDGYFKTPSGAIFGSLEGALNNMWRSRNK